MILGCSVSDILGSVDPVKSRQKTHSKHDLFLTRDVLHIEQFCDLSLADTDERVFKESPLSSRCKCIWMDLCMLGKCVHSFVASHRLVLLPCPLEVQAAILSALDDGPSAAGGFHVAIHLHS